MDTRLMFRLAQELGKPLEYHEAYRIAERIVEGAKGQEAIALHLLNLVKAGAEWPPNIQYAIWKISHPPLPYGFKMCGLCGATATGQDTLTHSDNCEARHE